MKSEDPQQKCPVACIKNQACWRKRRKCVYVLWNIPARQWICALLLRNGYNGSIKIQKAPIGKLLKRTAAMRKTILLWKTRIFTVVESKLWNGQCNNAPLLWVTVEAMIQFWIVLAREVFCLTFKAYWIPRKKMRLCMNLLLMSMPSFILNYESLSSIKSYWDYSDRRFSKHVSRSIEKQTKSAPPTKNTHCLLIV